MSENRNESVLASSKFVIERRKSDEITYSKFPVSSNSFLIDEVASVDSVTVGGVFDSSTPPAKESDRILTKDEEDKIVSMKRSFGLPDFLKNDNTYYYRVSAISEDGAQQSNFTSELKVTSKGELSPPLNFSVEIVNAKVRPVVARLYWETEKTKEPADYFLIERKVDSVNESYRAIASVYLEEEYLDYNVTPRIQIFI